MCGQNRQKEVLGEKSIFSPIGALEHLRERKKNIKSFGRLRI
jgi:hypothetical protein